MDSRTKQRCLQKACYGTGEWSANSGICRNCKLQDDCGKIEGKIKNGRKQKRK
jgi:hypothetical protein